MKVYIGTYVHKYIRNHSIGQGEMHVRMCYVCSCIRHYPVWVTSDIQCMGAVHTRVRIHMYVCMYV